MKQIHYNTHCSNNEEQSFVVIQHRPSRTLVLQEWSEGSLQHKFLPLVIQQLHRELLWVADDVIVLVKKEDGYYRMRYNIKRGSGMMPASARYYTYDVSNINLEFYSKDFKTHEILYGDSEE